MNPRNELKPGFKKSLKEKLDFDFTPEIERAHRTGRVYTKGRGDNKKKPGTVTCNIYNWKH